MWWRVLGVAVMLLGVGVVAGYAAADRSTEAPVRATDLGPVPAVSPAVPTPPERALLPDPDAPALAPDLPSSQVELRIARRAAGLAVNIPDGWTDNRIANSNMWTFVRTGNPLNTYGLRVSIVRGQNLSVQAAMAGRIAALEDAETNGALLDFTVTARTGDTFEATYIANGYLRVTMERWISFDGSNAYAEAAVTGRTVDQEGLRDLLTRTVDSMQPLEPRPPSPSPSDESP